MLYIASIWNSARTPVRFVVAGLCGCVIVLGSATFFFGIRGLPNLPVGGWWSFLHTATAMVFCGWAAHWSIGWLSWPKPVRTPAALGFLAGGVVGLVLVFGENSFPFGLGVAHVGAMPVMLNLVLRVSAPLGVAAYMLRQATVASETESPVVGEADGPST